MSHETAVSAGANSTAAVSCADNSSKVEVIVYTTKSDKTLKQNMNAKDDTLRKRTSLIIVPQQVDVEEQDATTKVRDNGNRNSTASMDSCVSNTTSQSNQSSGGGSSSSTSSSGSGSGSSSSSSSSGSEDAHGAYQDLQNGNAGQDLHSPSPVPRCHSSTSSSSASESTSCSSSADYSLREQLKNFANRNAEEQLRSSGAAVEPTIRLLKGMSLPVGGDQQSVPSALCDALLSPQEAPLGRRYAEVAQFKGHPKAR
ncbi:hypothetical protein M5D96_012200 [Drosophila gunungcola]|uniref:Uncharacterized protein n=2 Tax=Drosophila gunungcola TaxID=103775 RepID=A0A9P9YDF5_9MUSC|nr:hypothetical protein M5D96_012200 [Drosophila gunungcola]